MLRAAAGLTRVHTEALKRALSALHRGEVSCPLTVAELARVGLQHCAEDLLETLRDLDEKAVRAVLVAVLAERLQGVGRQRDER
jgi:hypothetical protein